MKNNPLKIDLNALNNELENTPPVEIIQKVSTLFTGNKALAISFQYEGLILFDMILKNKLQCRFYTIDTGRLHHETYQMMDTIRFKYNINLEIFYPDTKTVQNLTSQKGLFSFKESVANRTECCFIRKVEPNQRALKNTMVWFSGIRREQAESRQNTCIIEYHEPLNVYKVHPLVQFTSQDVKQYIEENKIPIHPLYKHGYKSIGCLPCTRAVEDHEDERAGRWWWESGVKECGLNLTSSYLK